MEWTRSILYRYRKAIIIGVSSIFLVLGAINVYFVLYINPVSNDECIWNPEPAPDGTMAMIFREVKEDGVTYNAGIRNGDRLLKMDDLALKNPLHAQDFLNSFQSGDSVKYTYSREGKTFESYVLIKKLLNFLNLSISLFTFFMMVVGFLVFLAKSDSPVQRAFFIIGISGVILQSENMYVNDLYKNIIMGTIEYPALGFAFLLFLFFMAATFAVSLLYFFMRFPRDFVLLRYKVFRVFIYSIPFLITALAGAEFAFTDYWMSDPQTLYAARLVNALIIFAYPAGFVFLQINAFKMRKTHPEMRKPLGIILAAYAGGAIAIIITSFVIPALDIIIYNTPEANLPAFLIPVLPIALGYSIFHYQLLDVTVVIRNTITYGTATVTVATLYLLSMYGIGQIVGSAIGTEYQSIIAALTFVAFSLIFQKTKDSFQDYITKKFFPEQFTYQQIIVDLNKDLTSVIGTTRILDKIFATFTSELKQKHFGILLFSNDGEPRVARQKGLTLPLILHPVKVETAFGAVKRLRDYYFKSAIEQIDFETVFPGFGGHLISDNIYTILPMLSGNRLIGFFLLGLKPSESQFAGKEIQLLQTVANQSAIALENARLYQAETERVKIEHDLDLARQIQQSLLPEDIPIPNGFDIYGKMVPAMQIGGDYFDFIHRSKDEVFVVVADVSGKGLSAALYMTKVQAILQLFCQTLDTPKEILIELNRSLEGTLPKNQFITITLALFDKQQKTVRICRAGHLPTFMRTKNGMVELKSQGLAIGLNRTNRFEALLEEEIIPLTQGDFFLFYSDGLEESMNENNEIFGREKVVELFGSDDTKSPKEIFQLLWDSIKLFQGEGEQHDDITAVILKV